MSRFDYNPYTKYIAPYWADAGITRSGEVFYRQTTDPSLLQRATDEIRAAYTIQNDVTMKNLLIVTWYRIGLDIDDTNDAVSATTDTIILLLFLCTYKLILWCKSVLHRYQFFLYCLSYIFFC